MTLNYLLDGSYYHTERGVLLQGDTINKMKKIKDNSVDLIQADLPFGTTQNRWDVIIPFAELWSEYKRIIKPNGAIVLNSVEPFTSMLIMSNLKMYKYKIVWEKSKATNFLNAKKQPLRKYEEVCVFYSKQPTYNPQMREGEPYNKGVRKDQLTGSYGDFKPVEVKSSGDRYPVDILYFKTAESEGETYHSTQKPLDLCKYLVNTYTNQGDLVLDNTSGSGTLAKACEETNRRWICIEREVKYCDATVKRLNQLKLGF